MPLTEDNASTVDTSGRVRVVPFRVRDDFTYDHGPQTPSRERRAAELEEISRRLRYVVPLLIVVATFCGTANVLLFKYINMQNERPCADCEPERINAPLLQLLANAAGQALCYLVHLLDKFVATKNGHPNALALDIVRAHELQLERAPWYIWIIPTLVDQASSLLILHALLISPASVVQVLRNFNLTICAILAVIILKQDLYLFAWFGVVITTIGLSFTAAGDASDKTHGNTALGSVMAIIGTTIAAIQLIYEESASRKFRISPFESVGMIGLLEIPLTAVLIGIFFAASRKNIHGFYQVLHSPRSILALLGVTLSIALFSTMSLALTKLTGGVSTAFIFSLRQISIWLIEMMIGWNDFNVFEFFGLIIVSLGFVIYIGQFPTKCWPWLDRVMNTTWEWDVYCYCIPEGEEEDEFEDLEAGSVDTGYDDQEFVASMEHQARGKRLLSREIWLVLEKDEAWVDPREAVSNRSVERFSENRFDSIDQSMETQDYDDEISSKPRAPLNVRTSNDLIERVRKQSSMMPRGAGRPRAVTEVWKGGPSRS